MAIPRAFASLSLTLFLVVSPLCCMAKDILYSGESLNTGDYLTYENYKFIMQADCNLVLYENGKALWASGTNGRGTNCYLILQSDGNLVIYNIKDNAVWASNTNKGQGNYVLILQKDRNVVIYGGALWATNTNKRTGVMFIESKATIFGALPANKTTDEVKAARIAMVVNK
ncbi:alpha-D-mannose-specific plant lectins domain-containing protein [Dioscorea alata]|uniref:Alpha-D-mannose-specific plant lectins domain-containing protein n=1 Tax=Dioscorea alata TaxID=55571 RepID=A0ACB7TZ70_DIOAL|nr:alpha-D-mannose-specific plant lectins domain-containing protein [Dioscorea alata]